MVNARQLCAARKGRHLPALFHCCNNLTIWVCRYAGFGTAFVPQVRAPHSRMTCSSLGKPPPLSQVNALHICESSHIPRKLPNFTTAFSSLIYRLSNFIFWNLVMRESGYGSEILLVLNHKARCYSGLDRKGRSLFGAFVFVVFSRK